MLNWNRLVLLWLICCLAPFSSMAKEAPSVDSMAELERVKERTIEFLLGGEGGGEYQKSALENLDAWCSKYLSETHGKLEWTANNRDTFNETLNQKASAIRRLALACGSEGSRYHKNRKAREAIVQGTEDLLEHFNPNTARPGNWYYWLIPLPRELGIIGLLAKDYMPEALFVRLLESLRFEMGEVLILTGANAVWEAKNHFLLALLERDETRLGRAAEHAFSAIRLGVGTAIREDYGYLFHGKLPYGGLYGGGYVETVSDFLYYLEGSPWAASSLHREIIVNLLLEHIRWFIYGDKIDLHILGRGYENGNRGWGPILKAMLIMSRTDSPRKDELTSAAKAMLENKAELEMEVAAIADTLSDHEGALPLGFRYWASGEIGVFNHADYHVGFRQYSKRVLDYEYLTGLGREGWNLAFGFTNVLRADGTSSWYARDDTLLPGIDMEHLPGTTSRIGGNPVNPPVTDPGKDTAGYSLNLGTSPFAGGVGWENGGVAGFDLIPEYGGYRAKKSLHFFKDGYWALGSDIVSTSDTQEFEDKPIHTTIIQWVCRSDSPNLIFNDKKCPPGPGETASLENVNWLWFDEIGVIFDHPEDVVLRMKRNILTLWIDHGPAPAKENYAFAVLPHSSIEATRDFEKRRPVKPVRYDSEVHAVTDRERLCDGMVYFQPSTCLGMKAESPLIIYKKGNAQNGIITIQDPLHTTGNLSARTSITQPVTRPDPDVRVTGVGSEDVHLDVAVSHGRTYRLGYGALGQRAQGVFREDLSTYDQFRVEVENDSTRTILTVHVPEQAIVGGYKLSIHGQKSHKLYELNDDDILDRPGHGIVRYQWLRNPAEGPGVFSSDMKQNQGNFRIYLRTPLVTAVDYFTVPHQ